MAGKKASSIPSVDEIRTYLNEFHKEIEDCIQNNKKFVIRKRAPTENVMLSNITLPLMEAGESIGTSGEEIWKLCKKIAQYTHAPVTLKEYERMIPFAASHDTVDTVLKLLETYEPPFDGSAGDWLCKFDITGYYYCIALISFSDYRQEDCFAMLKTVTQKFIDVKTDNLSILLRNMKLLENQRQFLKPLSLQLQNALEKLK